MRNIKITYSAEQVGVVTTTLLLQRLDWIKAHYSYGAGASNVIVKIEGKTIIISLEMGDK